MINDNAAPKGRCSRVPASKSARKLFFISYFRFSAERSKNKAYQFSLELSDALHKRLKILFSNIYLTNKN